MSYSKIEFPVPLLDISLQRLSEKELNKIHEWFIEIIPERIDQLELIVNQTLEGKKVWKADFTEKSISILDEWFLKQIVMKKYTPSEIDEIRREKKLPSEIILSEWTLDEKTESICIDVAMYLGEMLRKNNTNIQWSINKKTKSWRHSNSGFSILENDEHVFLDIVSGIRSVALLVAGHVGKYNLERYMEIWAKKLNLNLKTGISPID